MQTGTEAFGPMFIIVIIIIMLYISNNNNHQNNNIIRVGSRLMLFRPVWQKLQSYDLFTRLFELVLAWLDSKAVLFCRHRQPNKHVQPSARLSCSSVLLLLIA